MASAKAIAMLPQFFEIADLADRAVAVKEGEELSLGSHTLQFFMAPMVHWPEVMVEYEKSEKILFSADGFGKFGALDADEDWTCEARVYAVFSLMFCINRYNNGACTKTTDGNDRALSARC